MLFRIVGHWLLESSFVWLNLFLSNNRDQLWKTEGAGCLTLCCGSSHCFRSMRFSLPGRLWRGSRHVVHGLNSASSEKAVGEGWKVGSGESGEELLSNLRIWFTGAFRGKSLYLHLWFTSSSPHLLPSVQSDLCLFKIQPSLSDSVPAVSHPPGLTNPSPVSSLGLVGVIHKETPGEEEDVLSRVY